MTREDIYVIYYYERKPSGIVTVKYVDVDTNEEILHKVEDTQEYATYREQLQGLCGLEYTTEQKDIPYYNFVEELRPSNAMGVYTEEDIEVIYYYRKQTFNLSVEKQIERITVNGEPHSLKDGLDQIDVVASKVQETDIVVTYKIVVSNPSEIEGSSRSPSYTTTRRNKRINSCIKMDKKFKQLWTTNKHSSTYKHKQSSKL